MLEMTAVSKSFGSHRVLNGAWLQLHRGEVVGLVGANGAGKTTMMRIAAGLMRADRGTVKWDPSPPHIRYFGGESTLPMDVSARRWARVFGVACHEKRSIAALSRGTRQAFGLRLALHGAPSGLLLLDEPWDGLDPAAAGRLTESVRAWGNSGTAILISSHRLYDLDHVADRFVLLEEGRCRPILDQKDGRVGIERIAEMVARGSSRPPLAWRTISGRLSGSR